MRLIDADALRAAVMSTPPDRGLMYTSVIAKMIDDTPTITPDSLKHQWIPASERLPEKSGQYLVTAFELRWPKSTYDLIDSPTERAFVISMYFDNASKLWSDSNGFVINALIDLEDVLDGYVAEAWTPMPEPHDPYKNK